MTTLPWGLERLEDYVHLVVILRVYVIWGGWYELDSIDSISSLDDDFRLGLDFLTLYDSVLIRFGSCQEKNRINTAPKAEPTQQQINSEHCAGGSSTPNKWWICLKEHG